MTGTDTLALDGSRTMASSLEQNGHTYVETRITDSAGLFSCTWKSTTEAHTPTEAKRILPDLCADFIVDSTGKSWLVGPATGADLVSVAAGTTMWGIRINPPALRSLLGAAADAVQDSKIAFDDILTSRQAGCLPTHSVTKQSTLAYWASCGGDWNPTTESSVVTPRSSPPLRLRYERSPQTSVFPNVIFDARSRRRSGCPPK